MRALDIPPANHHKTESHGVVATTCSACKDPAASTSKREIRTRFFKKPPASLGGFSQECLALKIACRGSHRKVTEVIQKDMAISGGFGRLASVFALGGLE